MKLQEVVMRALRGSYWHLGLPLRARVYGLGPVFARARILESWGFGIGDPTAKP